MYHKKPTYKFINNSFVLENYNLLTTEYKNAKAKLNYICPKGHHHNITWNDWKTGSRCPYCSKRPPINLCMVNLSFEKENYICSSTEYINAKSKLDYICDKGHKHQTTWDVWRKGHRCPTCAGFSKPSIDFITKDFGSHGYTCLEDVYINSLTKMKYRCPKDHKHSTTWGSWRAGKRCPSCAGVIKYTIEFIKEFFKSHGCVLLSTEYVDNKSKLEYICNNGHTCITIFKSFKQGRRCTKCSNNGTSNFEKEVKKFVVNQSISIIENDRTTILNPNTNKFLELDILFPCKTKAIECSGIYWHSKHEAKERDKIKKQQCKELGINLLTVTDKEWYNSKEEVKNKILNFLEE